MKFIYIVLYYAFLIYLPESNNRYFLIFRKIRSFIASKIISKSGKNINIEKGANFGTGSGISIGDYSGIGVHCHVRGPLEIGNYVMMGPEVVILTNSHRFESTEIPICFQGSTIPRKVVIEDDVWIGTRVIILPGVTIGKGAIIGAGAIVTKSIPAWAIAAGNPARVIKFRRDCE